MRIVKKLYSKGDKTAYVSRVLDDVIRKTDVPLSFDKMEFSLGYGHTSIEDDRIVIALDTNDPLFQEKDRRLIKTLITFELFRITVRRKLNRNIPRLIEDVLIGRDMIRNGYSDDLVYLFYIFMFRHRITDMKDFIKFNLPWIIFYGRDSDFSELFHELAKNRIRYHYQLKLKVLFGALKKDLWNETHLNHAIKLYEVAMDAGH